MKSAKSGIAASGSTWVDQSKDKMSATVRSKFDAWRKAVSAERDAKKALDDHASAKARAAEFIGTDKYLCYGMGRGGSTGFFVKSVTDGESKAKPKSEGPSF